MRISLVAAGTRGDVQPYIALGEGLRRAGHDVRLLTSDDFALMAQEAGLTFCSTGPSVEKVLQSPEWRKAIQSGNFIAIIARMTAEMKKRGQASARELPGLLKDTDVLIAGASGMGGAFSIAEKFGIPVVQAYIFPLTPTSQFSSPVVPQLPPGSFLNRPSFHFLQQMLWQTARAMDAAVRRELGMGSPSIWGKLPAVGGPTLYGYSELALPRPDDWPADCQVTGYWFTESKGVLPDDLVRFLRAGKPPVYIGFGSMGNQNPEETTRIAIAALERAGQRGVLATGWGGMKAGQVPDSIYLTSSAPHGLLFSEMAAVVHHGGAGTTAAGLRAGVPSVIVPFFGDQPFWGQRIANLGVGPAPIPKAKLTVERLSEAITQCVEDKTLRQNAFNIGCRIRQENGVERAVELVEAYAARL